ncbi:MAG: aminoglycoside phosphotransferase family protein [Flavobacteriaceae bacterium]|nr:MAG: aminoglycoside phosphotransferase family protein [Flavobacteriaceae bacterium]
MNFYLTEIIEKFKLKGEIVSVNPYGNGHINDTYLVELQRKNGTLSRVILQRINQHVFKDPVGLMQNIEVVTSFMHRKILESGGDPSRESLTLVPTIFGTNFVLSEKGEYWRAYHYIQDTHSFDTVQNYEQVYEAGKSIGKFQALLIDCPPELLRDTIPFFHHTVKRFKNLAKAVEIDKVNLAATVEKEINFVVSRSDQVGRLLSLVEEGLLPLRITHNDTKFNNILFDVHEGYGVCVIDLDTVMPGVSLYDFGDSIRSIANPAAEDEQDLSKVCFDIKAFEHYTEGFLGAAGSFLTEVEIDLLPFSAILMTLECGMRFLTDYLEGDVYFKVSRSNHNLDRCRTQFKLVQDMEEKYSSMKKIVDRITSKK